MGRGVFRRQRRGAAQPADADREEMRGAERGVHAGHCAGRLRALDATALQGRIGEFIHEFERLLDLPRGLCERIINDQCGEPIVVAAVAMHMPIAVLQRILLLVNPAVGHSVERVFDLTNLAYDLERTAAVRLLSSWRDEARRDEAESPPAAASSASPLRARPPAGLRARFGALSERIAGRSVTLRSDRESAARSDLRSR